MKLVHVVGWYFPESTGGSEVYVSGLAREMRALGHEVLVAAPSDLEGERVYLHEGFPVYRYFAGRHYLQAEQSGGRTPASVKMLADWVERQRPDVVHFHSWTSGAGYWHIRRLYEDGYRVYLTLHTAAAFCARGTMRRWDRVPCDGEIRAVRCAACFFQHRGLPRPLAWALGSVGSSCSRIKDVIPGRLGTAWRYPSTLRLRHEQLMHTWQMCERIVAVCAWVRDSVLLNGCPPEKVVLCRQGAMVDQARPATRERPGQRPVRLGFVGRFAHVKGPLLLVEAVSCLPLSVKLTLELKGVPQDDEYSHRLKRAIGTDPRIRLVPPSPPDEVMEWMRGLDALVVPSRWMETGPLVVYEAFAAKVPVIGAGQGGIAELVQDGVNGLLFTPESVDDLTRVLRRACDSPELLGQMRDRIGPVRLMKDVAREMVAIYAAGGREAALDRQETKH